MPEDSRDLPAQGSVTAPDATAQERERAATVDEVLARGPQPPVSKPDQIRELLEESAQRRPSTLTEMRDRARAEQAQREEEELTGPGKPLSDAEAAAALSLMLSARKPAPPEDDWFKIDRLSNMLGAPFWIHMRGLTDGEYEALQQGAYREPTKLEKDAGVTGPVQDRGLLNKMVLVRAILSPKLTDEELITKFGPSPLDVVHKWFSPGEITTLAGYVSDMSGYAQGAVQRAKG
jgi:Phage XkdN-like tail assembly chaperone protein, TAC